MGQCNIPVLSTLNTVTFIPCITMFLPYQMLQHDSMEVYNNEYYRRAIIAVIGADSEGQSPRAQNTECVWGSEGLPNAESGIRLRSARIRARSARRMIDSLDHVQSRDRRTKGRNMN